LDFDETFTVALDGCCLKADQTKPNQLKVFSKTATTSQILMILSQKLQMDVGSNQPKPYQI